MLLGFLFSFFIFNFHADAKTLHMYMNSEPISLDWNSQATMVDAPLLVNLNEGLLSFSKSIKKSKDLKEYTFEIRSDAKWSDGRAIYAQDFVDSWQRLLSPQSTSIYSYYLFDVVNAQEFNSKKIKNFDGVGIIAKNDKTLVIQFKHAQPNWESTTTFWPLFPVRKDLIEKFGENWWRAGVLVSSGPFIFSSYEPGKRVHLKRNSFYRKTNSNVDEVQIDFIASQEEALKKYNENYFQFIGGIHFEKFNTRKDFHPIPLLRHHVIAFNADRFPMSNKFFRLAVLSCINLKELVPPGYPQLSMATSLIPSSMTGIKNDLNVPYDLKKAKEYFEKSGIVINKGTKISLLSGVNEPFFTIAKKFAAQIEKGLGITIEVLALKNQEFEAYSNLGEYNAVMISWTAKTRTAEDFLYPYSGFAVNRRTHFSSNDYDTAIANHQFKLAQKIILNDNAVLFPLFFEQAGYLSHSNIQGLNFDHRGLPLLKDIILK